jgi:hypothetical protein
MGETRQGHDYYLTRTSDLLAEFDADAARWRPLLVWQYGCDQAEAILRESRAEFETLIPQIPYIGGDEEPYTASLTESVRCLALQRVMQRHSKTVIEAGKIIADAVLSRAGETRPSIPPAQRLTPEQMMVRRRQRAARAQERRYPAGYVFEQKLYHALGADEFLPFYCYLDFAYSHVYGLGLTRTETLAEGGARCNHRFRSGRETVLCWPPPFVKE